MAYQAMGLAIKNEIITNIIYSFDKQGEYFN